MAAYIVPERVISPQKHWSLIKVLHDGGQKITRLPWDVGIMNPFLECDGMDLRIVL